MEQPRVEASVPPQAASPALAAATLLDDFVSMTKSRAAQKKEALVAQGPPDEPAAPKKSKTTHASDASVVVKIEHESTRAAYRVRLLRAGIKAKSSAFRYTAGSEHSKQKALQDAEALAVQWREEAR